MGATASLEPAAVRVDCGASTEVRVTVRNTGTLVDEMRLEVLGEPAAWSTVEPPVLRLYPGAEGTAVVRFGPPRDSRTPYGRLPFGLRVLSREDPAGGSVDEGQVEVVPFVDLTAEILPRTSRGWSRASHRIAVDNRGNAAVGVTLVGADPDAALDVDLTPAAFLAAPGSATIGRARVSARDRLWRGAPRTLPFTVTLQPDAGSVPGGGVDALTPVRLDATFAQQPVVPQTLPRTLATIAALVLAAIVAWTLVLRPTVENTAQKSVEKPLAGVNANIKTVADKVGVDVPTINSDGSTASASPGATKSPGATTDAGVLGVPVTFRLHLVTTPGAEDAQIEDEKKTVPLKPGEALTVTSFAVQNPFRDLGLIAISRRTGDRDPQEADGLLKASLSDITTQTTTFDPPLVLRAGETLEVTVVCTARGGLPTGQQDDNGQPQLAPQARGCDTSVLVNGYTRAADRTAATPTPTPEPSPS